MSFKSTRDLQELGSFLELVENSDDKASGQVSSDAQVALPLHVSGNGPSPSTPEPNLFAGGPEEPHFDLSTDLGSVEIISDERMQEPAGLDVPMSKSDYNRMLFEARMAAVGDAEIKMPWEQGVWKQIFSDDDSDIFHQLYHLSQESIFWQEHCSQLDRQIQDPWT